MIILLLLIGIIVSELYYLRQKTLKKSIESKALKAKTAKPIEENLTLLKEREDRDIIKIVDTYRRGYRDGCPKDGQMREESPGDNRYRRSYILGFQEGKKICVAKREKQREKEQYKKGRKEGCDTARGKSLQNKASYAQKGSYQKGWDEGYRECRKDEAESPKKKKQPPPKVVVNRRSLEYQKGYQHGCNASAGGFYRDENLYLRSREYRAGWTVGREKCSGKEIPEQKKSRKPPQVGYFDEGYGDGCDSAEGYFRKNRYKYEKYSDYRRGWLLGERECGRVQMEREFLSPPPFFPPPMGF